MNVHGINLNTLGPTKNNLMPRGHFEWNTNVKMAGSQLNFNN